MNITVADFGSAKRCVIACALQQSHAADRTGVFRRIIHDFADLDGSFSFTFFCFCFFFFFDLFWKATAPLCAIFDTWLRAWSLQWLQSYLSNRSLYVNVNSSTSKDFPISAGVPQGSHLGPVLFLAFINNLPDACCSSTEIYADDTLLHLIIPKNDHTTLEPLQASVTNAACWANLWRGRFSPSKTVTLPFGKTARKACLENNVIIENEVINVAVSHEHLRLTISTDLRWTAHRESFSAI